jgi:uncharacterized protein (TIGR00290 family)
VLFVPQRGRLVDSNLARLIPVNTRPTLVAPSELLPALLYAPRDRIRRMLGDGGSSHPVTGRAAAARCPSGSIRVFGMESTLNHGRSRGSIPMAASEDADPDPPPALVSWSSGKDAAHALCEIARTRVVRPVGLVTTVTEAFGRVSIHGVREELLRAQADALGLPLTIVRIPYPCPNDVYEREIQRALDAAVAVGIRHIVFGDLFLEDVRRYRETHMAEVGMECVFPLWHRPTDGLAREMIRTGLRARLVCLDPRVLTRSFAGRPFDERLLADLPNGVDPCGERGEFHTFVVDSPLFRSPIAVRPGETVERDGFVFADLKPG